MTGGLLRSPAVEGVPTIILCGGRGTRISEVNPLIPKPLLTIGERPVLWHIMKTYAHHGADDFVLALGWLGDEIRRYFLDYRSLTSDFTVDLGSGGLRHLDPVHERWTVTCLDTGRDSLTATRVRRSVERIGRPERFMVAYGDSVGDVDVAALMQFHESHGRLATVTTVRPPGRFGELVIDDGRVERFDEKPQTSGGWINGGYMIFEIEAIERFFPADDVMLEREPMSGLAAAGELMAFHHEGFWLPMDTPRERDVLEELWATSAPWAVWDR